MTISLCPVLMNFSMQITHLNQKTEAPVLFVVRQLRHQENSEKKYLLPPLLSSSVFLLCCLFFFFLLLQKPSTPSFLSSVCVWSVDGRAQLCRPNNWRNALRYLEFKMTSTHDCLVPKNPQNRGSFFFFSMCVRWVSVRTNCKSWAECNDSVLFFFYVFFFFHCSTAHELTGDQFLWAQHLYLLHLAVFSHSSSSLTTAPFLFSLPLRLDRPAGVGKKKEGERGKKERRGEHEPLIYDLHGSATLRAKFMNTFKFCAIGYRAPCKKNPQIAVPFLICCSMDHPVSWVGEVKRLMGDWPVARRTGPLSWCHGDWDQSILH